MSDRYDIAIIGTGPAGLSAAINAKTRNKKIIIFGSDELSIKVKKAERVNNYLGLINVTGEEMKNTFKKHIDSHGIEITKERINAIYNLGKYYVLEAGSKSYESTAIILATGVDFGKPFKGEKEYLGRGVGYCATCDGPLYKDKIVTIIGYNKEAIEDTRYMAEIASSVYYIPMSKDELDFDEENIHVIKDTVTEIVGENYVTEIILKNQRMKTDGVFILRETVASDVLVPGLKVDGPHVETNNLMETNLKGCFVAGDIAGKPYQYIKAAGNGLVASFSAVNYLAKVQEDEKKKVTTK